jgi:undecaprenyl-diphosphatase
MDILEAVILGGVQGITEFLPVSSSGHLILVPWFLGWEEQGLAFDVALHIGTLVALLWYFRKDWADFTRAGLQILRGRTEGPNQKMVLLIVAATVPGALAGLFGEGFVETYLRSPLVIAFTLIAIAIALIAAERTGRRNKSVDDISWTDAVAVGVAQGLAIIPGVSRSGVTITAGLFRGLERGAAARFSFLLSAPLIGGAAAKKSFDLVSAGITPDQAAMLGAGIISAAIVGYLAIAFMLRFLATHTTYAFIYYRIGLGIVVLLAFWSGFR